jgi:hypothetical protein
LCASAAENGRLADSLGLEQANMGGDAWEKSA